MPILLASEPELLLVHAAQLGKEGFVALIADGESALTPALDAVVDDLIPVDINGDRLSRVNFDAVALVILDMTPELLLSPPGRRLSDALGHLAKEGLTVAFTGQAIGVTGLFLEDGVTAGLNLVDKAVVLPDVQRVPDLQALLSRMSAQRTRLLALDTPVSAVYDYANDNVAVHGSGNVLLVGFAESGQAGRATARLHALTNGMQDGWPA